jgi:hypothetical protein
MRITLAITKNLYVSCGARSFVGCNAVLVEAAGLRQCDLGKFISLLSSFSSGAARTSGVS